MDEEEERGLRLADAMNTYNRALAIIRDKGYNIYLMPDEREEYYGDYWAIKGKRDFIAADPLRLLGLITLWEHFGDDWQARQVPDLCDEIAETAFPEDGYSALTEEEFANLVAYLRPFFEAQWKPLPLSVSKAELTRIMNSYYRDDE